MYPEHDRGSAGLSSSAQRQRITLRELAKFHQAGDDAFHKEHKLK
jgi:hypothetical protein